MPSFGLDEIQFGKLQAQLAEMPRDKQEEMTTEMIAKDEERKERMRKMAEKRANVRWQQTARKIQSVGAMKQNLSFAQVTSCYNCLLVG